MAELFASRGALAEVLYLFNTSIAQGHSISLNCMRLVDPFLIDVTGHDADALLLGAGVAKADTDLPCKRRQPRQKRISLKTEMTQSRLI